MKQLNKIRICLFLNVFLLGFISFFITFFAGNSKYFRFGPNDDFIFIEMGVDPSNKDYTVLCLFIGFDKVIKTTKNFIEIVTPIDKNIFFAPEVENINSLPAKLTYPNKSGYYSIGKIAVFLLSKNAKTRTIDEYKTDLAPLLNTKIYWMILRCLAYNPKNRYLLYI